MRWLLVVLLAPFIVLAGLQGQPNTRRPVEVKVPTQIVRVPLTPTAAPAMPVPTPGQSGNLLSELIAAARTWLGVPYLWAGCSRRGVDCSCFVQNVLAAVGIHVPRNTVAQKAFDQPIARADIRPGDTLFFDNTCSGCGANPTHETLYIGGGMMIGAGDPVQIESINTPYWIAHYDSAGRPPGL